MSRSGYTDDCDYIELYRATVERAIKGRRGQEFLRELAAAMDAMPKKELIAGQLITADGECCAIGVVCKSRGLSVRGVDYEDPAKVGKLVGIARALAAEIEYENDDDEGFYRDNSPSERWHRMRKWVASHIKQQEQGGGDAPERSALK